MERKSVKNAKELVKKVAHHKKIIIAIVMISIAFFGSFLVYFILQISLNTESPIVVVISGSMEPTIHEGDLLFVRGTNADQTEVGDVIVFDARELWTGAPQEPIVHRVIGKYLDGDTWMFITKGDANSLQDNAPVPESAIIGVVVGGIPYIGWIKIFLEESGLLIPLLVIISALLIISIVIDIIKGEDEEQDKNNKKNKKDSEMQAQKEE